MLLRIEFKTAEETRNRNAPGRWLILKCDACGIEFKKNHHHALRDQETHACSRACHGKLERKGSIRDSKKRQTSIKNFGVDHPRKSIIVEEARKKTCLERYGVEYSLQLDRVIDAAHSQSVEEIRKQSLIKANIKGEPAKKRHSTMKSNNSYGRISKPEAKCCELLQNIFGKENVDHDIWVNRWSIDFYIKTIDVYIQLDGIYFHGLDRPIAEISASQKPRDAFIYKRWLLDRTQDEWFRTNNLRLIRITDVQINNMSEDDLNSHLM